MEQQTFLIYNVTNKVSNNIHEDWLKWMRDYHIPAVLATGCYFKAVILRLKGVDDEEGPTYAIQYHAASEAQYERYLANFSTSLRKETIDKWGNQFIAFRTIMEVVN
ncbi:DUF4286 family protein [Niabella ginsengisoli]|uniref:DUF4286 family protein n=1 Tax=Niabella ginsengisoli TaxID=522298 RepID=A0ABS9SQ60_9BACT|nr:DUF4286 family protein [Niabella ginsengisoli]MCH5600528.1 DUF4286 family protein [Niabella ginsengisoli]